ncbi:hypothetical protein J5X98_08845 [Leptothermofonsia sichuanensis E412]|uniref:hypothetical protein n=1 Tax=Leptothermofonsia sichuanensis TaxID=2917832 RepID=UPI001CA7973F|nr:hypothetical protein [Leptothermofonsia sichuanensis]QZZ22458.1 hypothetical protein J5X98_08845 [Leptothermofonsia sichuanensis E412]
MSTPRSLLLLLCLPLAAVAAFSYAPPRSGAIEAEFIESIQMFKRVEQQVKSGVSPSRYPYLVAEVNIAIDRLPAHTPPRVIELLQSSSTAYTLAFKYWRCAQEPTRTLQATCQDGELEKVVAEFPRIRRNINRRLILRPNPPLYFSSSITNENMLQLLLMQAELNRVDAHLILTGGKFDGVYSAAN